jgi:hypothetical protein
MSPANHQRSSATANKKRFSKRSLETAALALAESLERRFLLSVTADTLISPLLTTGNTWTYNVFATQAPGGNQNVLTDTVKGPATYNGSSAIEIDWVYSGVFGSVDGKSYIQKDPAGDYVIINSTDAYYKADEAPYKVLVPASLQAGVAQTFSFSGQTTFTQPGQAPQTFSGTGMDQYTLVSETTAAVTVPFGTFNAYTVTDSATDATSQTSFSYLPLGIDSHAALKTTSFVPGIGLVKSVDSSITEALTSFKGSQNTLAVTLGPGNTSAGDVIDPGVKVAILKPSGSIDTSASTTITASITSTSTGTGTLGGTTTASTVDGVATFSNLTIDKPGQYSLNFTDAQGDTTASGLFQITGGKLVFIKPGPADGSAGSPLKSFTVELEDSKNRVITTDSSSVVTLTPISLKANPVITGNTAQLVNGKAVFSGLVLQNPDFYKLQADDGGDTEAVSSRFKISGDTLKFILPPKGGDPNVALPVTVGIFNAKGQLDTTATSMLQLSLNIVSGSPSALLGGTTLVQFVNGKAIFNTTAGPSVNLSGTYTLTATDEDTSLGTLGPSNLTTAITSPKFKISGFKLKFKLQPKSTDVDTALVFTVDIINSKGKLASTIDTGSVALTLNSTPATGGVLSSYNNIGFTAGEDEFSDGVSPSIDVPGKSYTLTVAALDDSGAVDSTIPAITSAKFQINGLHIVFAPQPKSLQTVDMPIGFTLKVEDSKGKIDPAQTDGVKLSSTTPGGSVGGSVGTPIFSAGVLTFASDSGVVSNEPVAEISTEGNYTITATAFNSDGAIDKTVAPATSIKFKVESYHLMFQHPIPNGTAAEFFAPFTLQIVNAQGKFLPEAPATTIRVAIDPNVDFQPGPLQPFTTDGGEVTFNNFEINVPGTYAITATAYASDGSISTAVRAVTSHDFRLFPRKLAFKIQPQSIAEGFVLPAFQVEVDDSEGKLINSDSIQIDIQISYKSTAPGSTPVILGDQTTQAGDLIANFNLYSIPTAGSYVIIAQALNDPDNTVAPITSKEFRIIG